MRGINLFRVDTGAAGASAQRPYVELTGAPGVAGLAVLDGIAYGDLNGDGADEAVVSVSSGGTAGNTGVLIFNVGAAGKVELTGPIDFYRGFGYKTGAVVQGGQLILRHTAAAGWEPNCCQSGTVERNYRIVNGVLAQQGPTVERGEPGARALTIEKFYEYVNAKNFDAAYQFFSIAQQGRQPFDTWKAGYATTRSVVATVENTPDGAATVKYKLRTVDSTPTGDLARTFTGTCSLVYSATKHQWVLDVCENQLGG